MIAGISKSLYGKKLCSSMSFRIVDSKLEPCLWLADWILWEVHRWISGKTLSAVFEACANLMTFVHFDDIGREVTSDKLGGRETGQHPDFPKDIQALCSGGN